MILSDVEQIYHTSKDPSERMEAVSALLRLSEPDWSFVEIFAAAALLNDPDPIVRHEAAFVLGELRETGRIGDDLGASALRRAALGDKSAIVRHEAAEAIYCFCGQSVDATLSQLLEDESEDVRYTALISLAWRKRYSVWLSQELWLKQLGHEVSKD